MCDSQYTRMEIPKKNIVLNSIENYKFWCVFYRREPYAIYNHDLYESHLCNSTAFCHVNEYSITLKKKETNTFKHTNIV